MSNESKGLDRKREKPSKSPVAENAMHFPSYSQKTASQAERIIRKFGGPRRLARVLSAAGRHRDPATVYRWTYPKDRGGTGGVIPARSLKEIIHAARVEGVFLTPEDLDPRGGVLSKTDKLGEPMGELPHEDTEGADDIFD